MCLSAIYWARLDRIYFANSREDAAAIGFDDELIYSEVSKPIEAPHHPDRQSAHPGGGGRLRRMEHKARQGRLLARTELPR